MEKAAILIVEDEPILSKDLARRLEGWGYSVAGMVTTAKDALEAASKTNFDLVIMDIALEGGDDGIDCAIKLKGMQDPAIVYLTAHSEQDLFTKAKPTEPQGYLGKPVAPLELQRTVEMALFKHRMQRRLRDSEQRLDLALKGADLGTWDWDIVTGKAILSETSYQMLGYEEGEFPVDYETWKSLIHPEDVDRVLKELKAHLKAKTDGYNVDYRLRRKDGHWKWVSAGGKVFERDSEGKALRMVGTILDISEKKEAEEALKKSEERYRFLVDTMNEGLASIDTNQRLMYVNDRFCKMLGYEREELIGAPTEKIIHEQVLEDHHWQFEQRKEGKRKRYETKLKTKDGKVLDVVLSGAPLFDDNGVFMGSFGVFTDITGWKTAQRLLLQAERLKALVDLSGGISHNFNNMLQIIVGNARLALNNLDTGDIGRLRNNLQWIMETSKNAGQTIKRLNFFSGKGLKSRDHVIFDLSGTVEQALDKGAAWLDNRMDDDTTDRVKKERNLQEGCYISGDENEMFELFLNLFRNALEAIEDEGLISVTSEVVDNEVVVKIHDTGKGIRAEDLPRLFEPFFTTKGGEKTGMGLSGSLGIAKGHGGDISIRSQEGQGATVTVRLPRAHPSGASGAVENPDARAAGGGALLIIDDLAPLAHMLGQGLESQGYTVFLADSGKKGLEIVEKSDIDVIICDLSMPEMDGRQTARAMADYHHSKGLNRPKFILLTGFTESLDESELMGDGLMDSFIEKPVDTLVLSGLIQEVLQRKDSD